MWLPSHGYQETILSFLHHEGSVQYGAIWHGMVLSGPIWYHLVASDMTWIYLVPSTIYYHLAHLMLSCTIW